MPVGQCRYCGSAIEVDMILAGLVVAKGKEMVVQHSCRAQAEAVSEFMRKQIEQGRVTLDRRVFVDLNERNNLPNREV